mgnify:FL=1
MKKYKLINNLTKEETLCDLVTIDEFDYYVNDNEIIQKDFYIDFRSDGNKLEQFKTKEDWVLVGICDSKKVITTNNPNIDMPKIINEFENLAEQDADKCEYYKHPNSDNGYYDHVEGFKAGYNKAKETHPFTEQDTIDFTEWTQNPDNCLYIPKIKTWYYKTKKYSTRELLQIFKELQPKTIFYE